MAVPITYTLLSRLPDRGYAFSKVVGLLVISYFFWLFASFGFVANDDGGLALAILILVAASVWASYQNRKSLSEASRVSAIQWMRKEWRYVVLTEIVFTSVFILWTWVRSQNPSITATEKPMEFAFLNSVGRSAEFPPLDPWLSGFSISYYYFGYVMTSLIGRLAAVPASIGFNLAIAWLVAGTSVGAFGIVVNLSSIGSAIRRRAVVLGLIAAIALPIAGNMQILLELLHGNGIGGEAMWEWLDVRDLDPPAIDSAEPRYERSHWWWWRSSRVIHEYHLSGRVEEGLEPIAEFPGFSFVLGDMHPHVLALPFAFLGLAVGLAWWQWGDPPIIHWNRKRQGQSRLHFISGGSGSNVAFLLFTSLVLGGLSFLNTWDVLIYLFVIIGTYTLVLWRRNGRWEGRVLKQTVTMAILIMLMAVILYLPFYLGFRSQAGPPFLLPMVMRPTRLIHFLIIFALPISTISIAIVAIIFRSRKALDPAIKRRVWTRSLVLTAALIGSLSLLLLILGFLVALMPEGASRIATLAQDLDLELPVLGLTPSGGTRLSWVIKTLAILIPLVIKVRLNYLYLTLFLALAIWSVIFLIHTLNNRGRLEIVREEYKLGGALPFVFLLVLTGLLLVLGTEFVYLRDNFGQRVNTVFKFYYQAWVLFGVAALALLGNLLRHNRSTGVVTAVVYGSLLAVALMFPWYAVTSRSIEYRGPKLNEDRIQPTLDGLDYLKRFNTNEYDAILWLQTKAGPTSTIVEAVGGQYSSFGRVSSISGIPTILGWAGHEYQWRGATAEPAERETAVEVIYSQANWPQTVELLNRYNIDFIYYGSLEKSTYGSAAIEKFDRGLEVAFRNDTVTIYHWLPNVN